MTFQSYRGAAPDLQLRAFLQRSDGSQFFHAADLHILNGDHQAIRTIQDLSL